MKRLLWLAAALVSGNALAEEAPEWPTQDGAVTVIWQQPDDYTDVRTGTGIQSRYQNHVFATLGKHLQKQIEPMLTEGQTITFTVTDLDLAGDVRPSMGRTTSDIRIIKSVYPPRIAFNYEVKDPAGQVVTQGEENIRDMGFDSRPPSRYRNESLRYELRMLDDWVRKSLPDQLASN
ncbi:DUF3016 domain-containing protein [Ferrimonas marina]|uniref:DUF3016 domain-containing protein n=1 Tax=Ferrimonas marina TaxID=299255 RepID=A0A1M5XAQ6_9GAMM|nr:DUF3016 domain-containing protein [Ferrimonas marina]SHH96866.1 Protein of unknown function [Ferrimonas marina]